jgi:uncharacterized protein (TIGR02246 family)
MFVASLLATSLARADTKADVLAVMNKEEDGFNSYDAKMIASLFSTDADWWNPFGVHLAGRAEIESFMTRLFSRPGYRSGKNTSQIVFEVRIATDNVAVVHGYEESAGQVDDDTGKKMDPRKSHYLDVLVKREGGWLIVSEMIMDEK